MINLILIFIFFSISAQNDQNNERVANSFIKEWIESNGSKECAAKYLAIDKTYIQDSKKNKFLFEWFSIFGKSIKDEINKGSGNYKIIAHEKNAKMDLIKEFNLETDDYSGVYYLVVGGKVINSIVVKNGKIISYCPLMNQGSKINKPWFINEPETKMSKTESIND